MQVALRSADKLALSPCLSLSPTLNPIMSFDDDITEAIAEIAAESGRNVSLKRGATTVQILAVPAQAMVEVLGRNEITLKASFRDYIIAVDDYDFGVGSEEPRSGDEILDLGNTYELLERAEDVPCWEYSDRGQTYYRVHTEERG